jgi:processive 1,2-diacylglycerol beta-glucosyltransferase
VLKVAPEIWESMYDNPDFQKRTKKIRDLLNRGNSRKMEKILREFRPDVVVCTQAFACGVLASWKQTKNLQTPALVGVLTDYVAHRYWAHDKVNLYLAPDEEPRNTLVEQGVEPARVKVHGIPICQHYAALVDKAAVIKALGLRPDLPKVLLMGGSLGLGPMKAVVRHLDKLPQPFDLIAVAGKNKDLVKRLRRKGRRLRHRTAVLGFAENVHELMSVADMVVTKPGGITTAEALVKQLPMIIINPIPGQEQKNTAFLLAHGVAVQAERAPDVAHYVDEFLRNPVRLQRMRAAARALGKPHAAQAAAEEIVRLMQSSARSSAVAASRAVVIA